LNGSGFFPNAESAMEWGQVNYVFDGVMLFERIHKIDFQTTSALHREVQKVLDTTNS
jgi:hypothetical protein